MNRIVFCLGILVVIAILAGLIYNNMDNYDNTYRPKHPELYKSIFSDKWLDPRCIKMLEDLDEGIPLDKVEYLRKEGDGVYSFPCVNGDFAKKLLEEVKHYEGSGQEIRRPNSMNNYGVILNEIGMKPFMDSLQDRVVSIPAKVLFPDVGYELDGHHTFTVRYKAGEDRSLDMHTDDSDVTFNLCLGDKFKGCKLQFCGDISKHNHRKHSLTYYHEIGRAVMHLGSRRHGADDIEEGVRTNLIMWSYNPKFRKTRRQRSERESSPPDLLCLSWTHDRDYNEQLERLTGKKDSRPPSPKAWCPKPGTEYIS